jgi:hypothetical protein
MKHIKSERLKNLEEELADLKQWLQLGLVPKKDIPKHKEEIEIIESRIDEEKERLRFLKESGDLDEYIAPKRTPAKAAFTEMPTLPDVDIAESGNTTVGQESEFDMDTEEYSESSQTDVKDKTESENSLVEEVEESYFSDENRWKRGSGRIVDPDEDRW